MTRPLFMVDDEDVDRLLFARLVRQANLPHPTRTFARGEDMIDALIAVLRGAPAPLACFIDVRMPGMNGFDVLRWIRCQRSLDEVPVVMLSSSEQTNDLNEARHAGAQCYLAKFPTAEQLRLLAGEAERVANATTSHAFKVPFNLLLEASPIG
jgi:CheY-like chemotaxis protein